MEQRNAMEQEALRNVATSAKLEESISAYAARYGGTDVDLDPDLEAASIEQMLEVKQSRA
jgi:hypothetical protein